MIIPNPSPSASSDLPPTTVAPPSESARLQSAVHLIRAAIREKDAEDKQLLLECAEELAYQGYLARRLAEGGRS
jgi:hypothetical protein